MKLPASDLELVGSVRVPARTLASGVWQQHLVEHPLFGLHWPSQTPGLDPLDRSTEGWDDPDLRAMTREDRQGLVTAIRGIWEAGSGCSIPEILGKSERSDGNDLPCARRCPRRVEARCSAIAENHPVSEGYAGMTESLLRAVSLSNGLQVTGVDLARRVCMLMLTKPGALARLVVLSVSLAERTRRPIVRISRGDGVRTELSLGSDAAWRTTYRQGLANASARGKFLNQVGVRDPKDSLSDLLVVARDVWEENGS